MEQRTSIHSRGTWRLAWAVAGMAVLGFVVAAITARDLPDVYPIHFGASGRPDRWVRGVGLEWFLLPIVGALMAALLVALGLGIPRLPPSAFSLPQKEAFLRLSPEARAPVLRAISQSVLAVALVLQAQFIAIQLAMFGSAVAGHLGAFIAVPIAGVVLTLATAIAMTVRFLRELRRATGGR
jgi:uncharacterized membrane protein